MTGANALMPHPCRYGVMKPRSGRPPPSLMELLAEATGPWATA